MDHFLISNQKNFALWKLNNKKEGKTQSFRSELWWLDPFSFTFYDLATFLTPFEKIDKVFIEQKPQNDI